MRRVRDVCLDAYSNQVSPEILREDMAKRGEERERLFDVWFQLEKERIEKLDMKGLETSWYMEGKEVTRIELSMGLGELNDKIIGMLEYDDRIFTAETTSQMLEDYYSLLAMMVADPAKHLSAVSLNETENVNSALVAGLDA